MTYGLSDIKFAPLDTYKHKSNNSDTSVCCSQVSQQTVATNNRTSEYCGPDPQQLRQPRHHTVIGT